jgi:hypothetical protein
MMAVISSTFDMAMYTWQQLQVQIPGPSPQSALFDRWAWWIPRFVSDEAENPVWFETNLQDCRATVEKRFFPRCDLGMIDFFYYREVPQNGKMPSPTTLFLLLILPH